MKKLVLILVSFISLFAFSSEVELFGNLFKVMFKKDNIKVYTKNYQRLGIGLKIVNSCKEADIVLGNVKCANKPRFVLDYYSFKHNKEAIGGFYWRKGRPQLRLRKDNLIKYKLFISKEFEGYLN